MVVGIIGGCSVVIVWGSCGLVFGCISVVSGYWCWFCVLVCLMGCLVCCYFVWVC